MRLPRTLVLALVLAPALAGEGALTEDTFESLLATLLPRPGELAWRRIAWRTSLWAGAWESQQTGRPLLFWGMNGHPLGCT